MRIAYVCADRGVPVFGRKGCSIHVQEVVHALLCEGAEVEVFAANCDGMPRPCLDSVLVRRLQAPAYCDLAEREQADLAANRSLRETLERDGPFDLVYERYSLWSYAGMEYGRDTCTPGLLEVNAPLIDEQAEYRGLLDREGAQEVARRVFSAAAMVIAVSAEVADYLHSAGVSRDCIAVIPNGVDCERFSPGIEPTMPGPPGSLTVGFVGTLKPWHGISVLVQAFDALRRRVPAARLLIVGDGPERPRLKGEVSARCMDDSVEFVGGVDAAEVPGLLASMDIAAAPYPDLPRFHFSPLKVYEYMASGLAVVASRTGQLAHLIEDGVTGILCRPGDAVELARALHRLAHAPELRVDLGRAARRETLENHTWRGVARRILALGSQARDVYRGQQGAQPAQEQELAYGHR